MYNFIKIQFKLKKISEEQVKSFIGKWITEEQSSQIIKEGN